MTMRSDENGDRVLAETRYLQLVDRAGWSFVKRPGVTGVVVVVAVTADGALLLVEQIRPPLGRSIIELPAGLVGDDPRRRHETLADAARRELEEETGFRAGTVAHLLDCPTSPGMTDELASFFLATDLRRTGPGGGVDGERITVHQVPLPQLRDWLLRQNAAGVPVAAKVLTGIQLARWQNPAVMIGDRGP